MSTGFIYGNRKNSLYKGSGMVTRDALKAIMTYGDCINSLFPQNIEVPAAITKFEEHYEDLKDFALPNRISQFYRVSTINEIKSALVNDGPVVFVINWYDDIKLDKSYILTSSRKKATGAHCMVIYGWDKNGWKFQNSWGTGWGNKGRAILPYDFPISEAWGVVDNITDENQDDIKKPFNSCIGQIIAKVVNAIINLFKKK